MWAQAFDLKRLKTTGDAVPVGEQLASTGISGAVAFSASDTGVLAYGTGPSSRAGIELDWVDRILQEVGTPEQYSGFDLSPDGALIAAHRRDGTENAGDIWLAPMTGDRKPRPVANTQFREQHGQISPDGRWVAYDSNDTDTHGLGITDIYVQPLWEPGGRKLISIGGGSLPRWRGDGKALFYVSQGNIVEAAFSSNGGKFEAGSPAPLFEAHLGYIDSLRDYFPYAVTKDGQRFLIQRQNADRQHNYPIVVVLNWLSAIEK